MATPVRALEGLPCCPCGALSGSDLGVERSHRPVITKAAQAFDLAHRPVGGHGAAGYGIVYLGGRKAGPHSAVNS
jgi:hypothetical protein